MATTTPNFGWAVPTSTDLVKDGAVAIETLGDAIDASLVDLKGGTTGQVLSKASNTNMDFTWTTSGGGSSTFVGCYLQKSANQSINNTTLTTVTWDVETLDSDGFHSNVTNNSRITIPSGKAGKYSIGVSLNWASNSTGLRQILFAKNGTTFSWSQNGTATTGATMVNKNIIVDLAVGDYVEIQAYQTSGGALNLQSNAVDTDLSNYYAYYLGA